METDAGAWSPRSSRGLRAVLYLASSLTVMAGAAIAPALPALRDHFGSAPEISLRLSLVVTLPALCTAIISPASGWIGDRAGRRTVLIASLWLYAATGAAGLLLSDLNLILLSRALVGVAVALIMTSAIGIVGDCFRGNARRVVVGRQASWTAIGGILFPLVGGLFTDIGWRGAFVPFLLAAPLALWAQAVLPRRRVSPAPTRHNRISLATLRPVLPAYGIAIAGMALFNVFPMKIGFHLESSPALLPSGMGAGLGTGVALGWLSACAALTSAIFGGIYAKIGRRGCTSAFFLLFGAGYAGIGIAESALFLMLANTVAGLGLGLLMPVVSHWVLEGSPEATRGTLLGGLTTAVFAGQFCAQFIADPLVFLLGSGGTFVTLGAIAMLGGILRHLITPRQ